MKKYLLWLSLVVIGAAMYSPVKEAITEKPVDKNISFAVFKGNEYSSNIYNNTSAKLHITIEKVEGDCRTQVWSETFDAKQLKQFPSMEQATTHIVTIPKVFSREQLEVTYTITYDSDGSELQMQSGEVVSGKAKSGRLIISI